MTPYELLISEYQKRTAALTEEKDKLTLDLDRLRQARGELTPISEAKLRTLSTKADAELSLGSTKKAEALRQEIEKVKSAQVELARKIDQAGSRLQEIESERVRIANQVLAELYPDLQVECRRKIEEMVAFLENTWQDLQDYGETGAKVNSPLRNNLTPSRVGADRLMQRLLKWF